LTAFLIVSVKRTIDIILTKSRYRPLNISHQPSINMLAIKSVGLFAFVAKSCHFRVWRGGQQTPRRVTSLKACQL